VRKKKRIGVEVSDLLVCFCHARLSIGIIGTYYEFTGAWFFDISARRWRLYITSWWRALVAGTCGGQDGSFLL